MQEVTTLPGRRAEAFACLGPVIEGRDLEPSVTIIAAMRDGDDAILIASDSQVIDSGLKDYGGKLQTIEGATIAWACAGNDTITSDFNTWLKSYIWPPSDWSVLRDQAIEKIARLNGRQRELMKLAGEEWKDEYGAICLLVGWLDDEPMILELDDKGRATHYLNEGFYAIGTGGWVARVAKKVLRLLNVPEEPVKQLRWLMDFTIATAEKCGQPVTCWRVTRKSVEILESLVP